MVGTIKRTDWDRAHTVFTEQLRDAKRNWSDVTGAGTYGINKAAKWLPDGWSAEIVGMGEERARSIESDARDRLSGLETSAAISADRRQRREDAANRIPDLEEKLRILDAEVEAIRAKGLTVKGNDAEKARDETGRRWRELKNEQDGKPKEVGKCPDCGAVLAWGKGKKLVNTAKFEVAPDIDERVNTASEEYDAAERAYNSIMGEIRESAAKVEALLHTRSRTEAEIMRMKADAELENVEMVSPEAVDEARAELNEASRNVGIVTQMVAAARASAAVSELAIVVQQLAPSGVRAGGMGGVLDRVNNGLRVIRKITGWGLVKVEKDFSITYEGRPPELIAASERARINYAMQAVFALITKSGFVAFQGVDILQGEPKRGMERLLVQISEQNKKMRVVADGTNIDERFPVGVWDNLVSVD